MVKQSFKTMTLLGAAIVMVFLVTNIASAAKKMKYKEGTAGEASIGGKISFKGTAPEPKLFAFAKFPQPKFCSQADSDGKGNRMLREVTVNDGKLQDVVVYIKKIGSGKPFKFDGADVKANKCRFLVQGGPSAFVGVVVKNKPLRVLNTDADPTDPKTADGVLHNPHGYEVKGVSSSTMFNKPLPNKGQTVKIKKVKIRKKGSTMKMECDQHGYMQVYFQPVTNPYYSIVGADGAFTIDKVPAGKYTLVAWHPILGAQEKEVEVGASGTVSADFEFSGK